MWPTKDLNPSLTHDSYEELIWKWHHHDSYEELSTVEGKALKVTERGVSSIIPETMTQKDYYNSLY